MNDSKLHDAAQRAFKHYELHSQPASPASEKRFTVRTGLGTEEALSNASEILESAAVSAYDCSSRKQVLAVVQLIEMAQLLVDAALNRECPVA